MTRPRGGRGGRAVTREDVQLAHDWIGTDRAAVADDVRRLGVKGAALYHLGLICAARRLGDRRWDGMILPALIRALAALEKETRR